MFREFWPVGVAVIVGFAAGVLGVTYPRPQHVKPPNLGTTDLAQLGCQYIRDVGDAHGIPTTGCVRIGGQSYDGGALARFRVKLASGVTITLRLRFAHSTWQITAVEDK